MGVSVAGAVLNTQLTSAVTPLIIADLWASGLYKYDKTGAKKPQVASSWDISADGKTYTFHLRPNLKWSDGHAFSSEDVAFTLKAFAQYNTYLVKVIPNIDRVETPDANTFVVYLKEPQSSALEGFDKEVFPLMPKHIYENTDIPTNPANRAPVGMGPFRFVKWEEGRGITFERNEYYWDQPRPISTRWSPCSFPTCSSSRTRSIAARSMCCGRRCRRSAAPWSRPRRRAPSKCARSRSTPPSGCRST